MAHTCGSKNEFVEELIERSRQHVDNVAIEHGASRTSYACLLEKLGKRVAELSGSISAGDLVVIEAPKSVEFVLDLLAVMSVGAIPVPLDPDIPQKRREILLDQLPGARLLGACAFEQAKNGHSRRGGPDVVHHDAAYVFFTSGSTGHPRPVLGATGALRSFISWQCAEFGVRPGDRVGFLTAVGFDVSLRDILLPLWSGATLVIPEQRETGSPEATVTWLQDKMISLVHVVPSVARSWLSQSRTVCDSIRTVFFAGEPLTGELLDDWRRVFPATSVGVNLYGPTETTLAKFYRRVGAEDVRATAVPVGRPLPRTQAVLLRPDDRFDVDSVRTRMNQPAAEGEIVIVTPHASRGYLNQPEATAQRFLTLDEGLTAYRTGDLGHWTPDGDLVVAGRTDDEVKINGIRIHPAEVTAALRVHPGIRDAFVMPIHPAGARAKDATLVAFVVGAGALPPLQDLRVHLLDRLQSAAAVPSRFVELEALPLTYNGKVDRAALTGLDRPVPAERPFVAPAGAEEQWLARQWADLLSIDEVSASQDFFSLGGTSLFVMQLLGRIRREFNIDLSVREVFNRPTIRALADRLAGCGDADSDNQTPQPAAGETLIPTIDRQSDRLPMSFAQRRLYFLQALAPEGTAYNIPVTMRLRGPVDVSRLRKALRALVDRHEVLRTVCVPGSGLPELMPAEPAMIERASAIEIVDPHEGPNLAPLDKALAIMAERTEQPFNLDAEIPLRAVLVPLAGDDHLFGLVIHHIISDEDSSQLLVRELFTAYEEDPSELPPMPIQYADFAAWQHDQLTEARAAELLGFWREHLAGMPPTLELPVDRQPIRGDDRGGELSFELDSELCARLRAVAGATATTPFVPLLVAFGYVLHRHCDTTDVVFGSPVADRPRPELEELLGCFINTVPLRLHLAGTPAVRELIDQAGEHLLGALDHRDLPFERLIADLRPERDGAEQLLRATFNHFVAPKSFSVGPDLVIEPVTLARTRAHFDLSCQVRDHGETMTVHLVHATGRVSATLARRIGEHFVETVRAMLGDVDAPVTALPAVPHADEEELLEPDIECGLHPLAIDRFEAHAERDGRRIAVRCRDEMATYTELNQRANRLAHHLRRVGIMPGAVVGLLFQRSVDMIVAMLAAQKAGAVYVPLDPHYPADHIAAVLDAADAAVLLTHDAVESAQLTALISTQMLVLDRLAVTLASYPTTNPGLSIDPGSPMYILFTSGSTGQPKGVLVEHSNVASYLAALVSRMDLPEHLSFAMVTTFAADLGMTNLYGALCTGGTLHVIPYEWATDPAVLAEYFSRHRIDFMKSVPSHLQALHDAGVLDAVVPRRYLVLAGERLPWHLVDSVRAARPECQIWNHYGPTETTVSVLAHRVPDAPDERSGRTVPIGHPLDRVRAHVVDSQLRPVPIGTPGELVISGASVARGYLRPVEPAPFIPDPFASTPGGRAYRTGDRVRRLRNGAVEFLGRIDRQLKIRGYRVEPSHIEAAMRRHPGVAEVVVVLRNDIRERPVLVAYWVAARSTAIPTSQALRDHAHSQLPLYMAPSAYIRLDSMPLTVNGKLDSRALPKPDSGTEHDERTPARHELDERIITIWQDTLGVECIGIDDDFFHLGGDSLTVMRVIRHIDPRLRVVTLFQNPTIRQLSDAITNSDDRDNGLLCRISPPTSSPPAATIVAVPYGGGSAASYRELATALPDEYPLYAVDIPGHDFADATQPLEPFDTVVQRVVAEIRDKIDGPVLVYGHCVGSAMATAITYGTHEHGAEVLGAALGGAYPSPYLPGRLAQRWAQLFPSDRWKSDRAYRERLSMVGGFSDAIDPAEQEFIVRALRHDSRGADAYFSEHCDGRSQQRRLPALCVVGEYDRLTEFHTERHHEWNMLYTHTDLAVVPHAGHYFLKHQPDQLAATLVGWINRRRDALAAPADTLSGNVSQPTSYDTPLPAPPTADSGTVVIRSSLRDFLLVCVGQLLTMTGTRISAFGLGVWTYTLTGQATLFSLTLACAVLPGLLVLPFAGAAVDRWDRRGVMIVGDVIGGAGIALCLAMYALGGLAPWHTYLAAAAGSIATNFQQPAFLAATAQLVPKQYLARINGLLQGLIATSQAAGPLLGAALVFATGVGWMLTIDVITTLVSITFLLVVAFPDTLFRKREESMWKEISGGFRYIARRPGLVAINGYFLVYNLFLGFAIALIPLMILSFGSAGTLSLAGALEGIGGIIGGLAMGLWGGFARRATGMIGFGILTGIGMIIAGLYPAPVFPILGVTAVGASIALLNGHWRTLIQNKVGMELQGRIITTNRMVANLSEPVGVLCAGWLADMWFEPAVHSGGWLGHTIRSIFGQSGEHGIALMLMVFGVAEALLAIIGLRWRVLRYIEDVLPDAVLGATVTWDRDQLQAEADRLLRQAEQDFDRVTQSPDHSSHLRTFSIRPQHTMGQTGRDGL